MHKKRRPFWVALFVLLWDGLLSLSVRTENIHNLMDIKLLHLVTSRSEVLAWVELSRLLVKHLTNSSCKGKT